MIVYPNAKINIGLKILSKRPDGFHNLETVFYPVEKYDILEITEASKVKLVQYGIPYPGEACDNLCIKAYQALKQDFDLPPVAIYLYKNIPVGAGLGGGSSDAAHTIIALNQLYHLNLTYPQMAQYASQLGSDCAFFIYNKPMLGEERGEKLTPIAVDILKNYQIKLVHPPFFVSTAEAYSNVVPRNIKEQRGEKPDSRLLPELLNAPVEEWKNLIINDFEETIFAKKPQLKEYKEALYRQGAIYASMSGSGSTLFGIFKK